MIPTSTDVSIQVKDRIPADSDAVDVFALEGGERAGESDALRESERRAVRRLFDAGVARGKAREVVFDVVDGEAERGKFRRVIVAGLGKAEKATAESVRQAAGAVVKALRKHRLFRAAVVPPAPAAGVTVSAEAAAQAAVVGMLLAAFDYEEYKGAARKKKEAEDDAPKRRLDVTVVASGDDARTIRAAVERGRIIADGQNFARTIASRPGNDVNPPELARVAQRLAREVGLDCRVLDEKQMQRMGMGGILAVGSGSIYAPPRMIVLTHRPGRIKGARARAKAGRGQAPLLVVGKAITFDTGG